MRNPDTPRSAESTERGDNNRLSYKFQRLREKLRAAIASGELSGKLPGERELARKFHVNAKTLSKALTDLAAEGLLERSIGRGTFVRGAGAPPAAVERWLVLCDDPMWDAVIEKLRAANPLLELQPRLLDPRPSFLNGFGVVIDFNADTSVELVRNLLVRNMTVIKVNHIPENYSTHAVMIDRCLAAANLTRDLMLQGHRRLMVIERAGSEEVIASVQRIAQRYDSGVAIDVGEAHDAVTAVRQGATAIICASAADATDARNALEQAGVRVPADVSVSALGLADPRSACTGFFVTPAQVADGILQLQRQGMSHRPTVIWLSGGFVDARTSDTPALRILPADVPLQSRAIVG